LGGTSRFVFGVRLIGAVDGRNPTFSNLFFSESIFIRRWWGFRVWSGIIAIPEWVRFRLFISLVFFLSPIVYLSSFLSISLVFFLSPIVFPFSFLVLSSFLSISSIVYLFSFLFPTPIVFLPFVTIVSLLIVTISRFLIHVVIALFPAYAVIGFLRFRFRVAFSLSFTLSIL